MKLDAQVQLPSKTENFHQQHFLRPFVQEGRQMAHQGFSTGSCNGRYALSAGAVERVFLKYSTKTNEILLS